MKITRRLLFCIASALTLNFLPNPAFALDGIVYIISGGPFDTGGSANDNYTKFLTAVGAHLPNSDLYLARLHNSKQDEVCSDIVKHKQDHPEARLVLAGHSYGSDAAVWTSRCLADKGITVDFLLTLDTVPRVTSDAANSIIIPENVKFNVHFYQQGDSMIQGSGPNHRADNSRRGIYTFKQNLGSTPVTTHLSVLKYIDQYDVGPNLAASIVQGLDPQTAWQNVQSNLAHYLKDHPAEATTQPENTLQ